MLVPRLLVLCTYCAAEALAVIFEGPTPEILTKKYDIIIVGGESDSRPRTGCYR